MRIDEAIVYVGGGNPKEWAVASELQFKVLRDHGLTPSSSVLEVGAGCLGLARLLVPYLNEGGYTGIEPNEDVTGAVAPLDPDRDTILLTCSDFDSSEAERTFDIVFAHSVLTHIGAPQLPEFLHNIRPHLREGSLILASLRLGEKDTATDTWTYPRAVEFSLETLEATSKQEGYTVELRSAIRDKCEAALPRMFHDWVLFRPVAPASE